MTKNKIYCLTVADPAAKQYHAYAISEASQDIISTETCNEAGDVREMFVNQYHTGIFKAHFPKGFELVWVNDQLLIPFQIKSIRKGSKL